jgi:hypothetical protein
MNKTTQKTENETGMSQEIYLFWNFEYLERIIDEVVQE